MKKLLLALLLAVWLPPLAHGQAPVTNRYAMRLDPDGEGGYTLHDRERYARILDLQRIEDLLEPYTPQRRRLRKEECRGVEVRRIVYKHHKDYSLEMAVDMALSDRPAPVIVYCHGGGWVRGSNRSHRELSHYLARQHGIAGVRIAYTLAPQPGARVEVSIDDVLAAVRYLREHAAELNIDPSRIGFLGTSAGAHLAAAGAMRTRGAKLVVGYSGIYDLRTAAICRQTDQPRRIAYFRNLRPRTLRAASPVCRIPRRRIPAALLVCGTGDISVEHTQSADFAEALRRRGGKVDLRIYPCYDHNLSGNTSDRMEEIFFLTVAFIVENLRQAPTPDAPETQIDRPRQTADRNDDAAFRNADGRTLSGGGNFLSKINKK